MITKDPIVISFFTDDPYYESQAEFFADDCRRLGLKLYVEEFEAREWASSCAQKANFILKCLRQTQSPVVWIDIDTRIIRNPVDFLPPNVDFAAFTRSFSHLSKFPLLAKRFWTPGYLYFNYTREALAFAEAMVEFGTAQNKLHTDDYLLHKAWIERGRDLTVFPIPPKYATYYKGRILGSDSRLLFQASGNAPQNKNKVVQHVLWTSSEEVDGDLQAVTTQHELIQKLIRPKEKRKKKKSAFGAWKNVRAGVRKLRRHAKSFVTKDSSGKQENALPAFWYGGKESGNFGDILGPIILRRIFGVNPIFTRPENGPTLFLVGSIARFATPLSTIWGSGAASIADQINPSARILAVRGPLTAKIVARDGGKAPQAMGDPGILLRELHRDIRTARSAKYGLIPHVAHEATLRSRHAKQLDNFDIISMQAEGESGVRHIVEQIANCEFVFSTSLHGFIVAHALGVRAAPVFAPGPFQIISGFDFKFRDYCASVGITFEFLDLRDVLSNPGNAANKCSLPGDKILDSHCDALRTAMNEYLSTVRNQF